MPTVTHIDQSKSGKTRIYLDNKNNWQDAYYLGNRCAAPKLGDVIVPSTSSKDFNGRTTWFLNDWKPASNGHAWPARAVTTPPLVLPRIPGWDIPTGDLSRFVSNVVGSAIAAQLITAPRDMAPWIASCYRALEAVRAGKILDFDDEPPNLGPDPGEQQGFDDDPGPQDPF